MKKERSPPKINKLTRKISQLSKEVDMKNSKIIEQQRCITILENALRDNNNITEFEQLLAVVRSKDERINELERVVNNKTGVFAFIQNDKDKRIMELEEALKDSFLIAAERERVFFNEEQRRIENLKKMKKMEQRLKSLQNASAMRCNTCSPLLKMLKRLEVEVTTLEREKVLQIREMARAVQNILEEIISEKDTQIAELEIKGVLDEYETNRRDALKEERDKLLRRLKYENEHFLHLEMVKYQDCSAAEEFTTLPVDLTVADEVVAFDEVNDEDIPATVL